MWKDDLLFFHIFPFGFLKMYFSFEGFYVFILSFVLFFRAGGDQDSALVLWEEPVLQTLSV